MKRKLFCFLFLSILTYGKAYACEMSDTTHTPVPLIIKGSGGDNGDYHRGYSQSIVIYQDGGLLDFGTVYSGCSVVVINENGLTEYSGVVGTDGIVVLPDYLEGLFELQLTVDNIVYAGEILLE